MGTPMGEAAKMKILILIFPLAGMGLPSASPSAARITMKSSRRGKIFRDHDLELQFTEARDEERLTKGPRLMNHICQITLGCLCASDNGSVHCVRQALRDLSLCDLFPVFFLVSQNYMSIHLHARNGRKKLCLA